MPIYEYQCQACGHEFEALQKISDAALTDCPSCSQAELKKKISAAAFRLKGGGWYETDFKSGDKKKNLAGDSSKPAGDSAKSGASKAGEKKADSKPSAAAGG
jgi:putative FmdB family regulatory protein